MGSRKRGRDEMEAVEAAPEHALLDRLRNTWELANIMQYIFIFGRAVKIDEDLTIEDLENECLLPESSTVLSDIGLALLKNVSSHRGLTPEIFDEYTRRQYIAKAPQRNPFGEDDEPKKFADFDVFTKLKILVQLSQWTLINADRIRERMEESKESEQTQWRVEEIGYDKEERHYIVLDDNRLYRRTEPPLPPAPKVKPKANSQKGKIAARASKRRKTLELEESANDADVDTPAAEDGEGGVRAEDNGLGGRKWECIAVTLDQYKSFLASIQKSRDPDEKYLYQRITSDVLPVIEKAEESQQRKKQKQERELINLQKLATAKRSSRLEAKMEREREEREEAEAERKKKADLVAAKQDQEKQKKMEEARESRMMTREQRIKDREYKRLLHEEELANLSEENKRIEAGEAKKSERHLKTEMEKKKAELAALQIEDEWVFDCAKCGKHGTNLDDGTHSVACDKCNVWQHSACLGITQLEAEKDDFHFICNICKRKEEDAKKPKIPSLKFHIGSSSSPPNLKPKVVTRDTIELETPKFVEKPSQMPPLKKFKPVDTSRGPQESRDTRPPLFKNERQNGQTKPSVPSTQNAMHATVMNGPRLSPQGQVQPSNYSGNQEESFYAMRPVVSESNRRSSGPRSPAAVPAYTNGYSPYLNQNGYNGYVPKLPPNAFQSPYTGNTPYTSHQPQGVGWSARYTPPQQAQHGQQHGPPPPSTKTYATASDRLQSASSHPTGNAASPMNNEPSISPSQSSSSNYVAQHYQTSQTSQINRHQQPSYTNGTTPYQSLPPIGASAYSPTKQKSPPAPPPPLHRPSSSSPVTHQPPLHNTVPASPGFSPMKHSPPRQVSSISTSTPASLPPAPQLTPGSALQDGGA